MLDIGESRSWLHHLSTLVKAVLVTRAVKVGSAGTIAGEAIFGSSETVTISDMSLATSSSPPDPYAKAGFQWYRKHL